MRSEARLDSAVFQLTPTRTRCDLVIVADGKTEKLASGLLTPFLAHLKTAQDQIAKGGYSITLEPDPEIDAVWFTKGTVERFVRFVSTPELLERVTTIESEILQIENAIAIQSNDSLGLNTVEDHQTKTAENIEGTKSSVDNDAGKAIVLYKPVSQPNTPEANGSTPQEENSKVQLLKVLETRKMVLRKEQGMAFARAAAAGFDMDNMLDLIPFAESFGASRLREACIRFMDLWKKKHETGQWLEIEALEAMSTRSEFAALNPTGIVFTADSIIQKDNGDARSISGGDVAADIEGKADPKVSLGHQDYFQGQFQHPNYPQWPMHGPPGPMFQPYPMQGMPYYQNYPGSIPYFHPPYPPMEDHRHSSSRRKGSKRQSMDRRDIESETWERSTPSEDDTDENASDNEKEGSHGHKSHKRGGRSGKKKSGVVVIKNLNYIASKKRGGDSESDQRSASESEAEEESEVMRETKHKHSGRTSKKEDGQTKHVDYSDAFGNDKATYGGDADSGNWQAFQSFLLEAEEKARTVDEDLFTREKEPTSKRKQSKGEADPIVPHQDYGDFDDRRMVGFNSANGNANRMKRTPYDDQLFVSSNGRDAIDNQFKEIESVGGAYRRTSNDEFMIYEQEKRFNGRTSSDPLIDPANEFAGKAAEPTKASSHNITDESFLLPFRSNSQEYVPDSITVIDMDSEIPATPQKVQDTNDNSQSQLWCEPDELSMVPDRGMESLSIGYDPAMDYDFETPVVNTAKEEEASNQEDLETTTKEEPQKLDKVKNLRASNDSMEKRRKDALAKRGTSSRLNALTEAQKRAEKLRSYKVDLQKAKKEREEEDRKRLEALKMERQKRIAARTGSTTTQSPSTPQQTKSRLATKPSPSPFKGSKFSDAEPASSPLRKMPVRTSLNGSSDPQKATKSSTSNAHSIGITRSTSSLPELKKESNGLMPEAKTDSLRLKRLSDPKSSSTHHSSAVKSVTADQPPKKSVPDESRKNITEIMQLDKSKSATLPELRIGSKTSSERVEIETAGKGTLKENGGKMSLVSDGIEGKSTNAKSPSNSDENLVIEKTVVMLEDNVVTAPTILLSEEMINTKDRPNGDGSVTGYATIHAPPSSVVVTQVDNSDESKLDVLQSFHEVVAPYSEKETPKFSESIVTAKPYEAPYARATSLEDPVTDNVENEGGSAALESEMVTVHAKSSTINMSNFENSTLGDQTHEKPRSKEAKGFRKLLKFGRKSHSSASGEANLDSDVSSVDDQTVSAASTTDVSRSFSLLSPFRSKNSEKKQTA